MGEELKFQHRWELRRTENDKSEDSKSSVEPALKKHKLISSLISLDKGENSETSRLQQEENGHPAAEEQINVRKSKKKNIRTAGDNLRESETNRDSPEEVCRRKGKAGASDYDILEDVKKFMGSLLEDLKVSRENLFKWMREEMLKLVEGDTASQPKRRKPSCRVPNARSQHQKKFEKNVQEQHQKVLKKSMQFQSQNSSEENVQGQQHSKFEEAVHVQQQDNSTENIDLPHQKVEKIHMLHQNNIKSGTRSQKGNERSLERSAKTANAFISSNYFEGRDNRLDSRQGTDELITPAKKHIGENVQVESQKSVVLAIEAPKCNGGSYKRTRKGKTTIDSGGHHQVPKYQGDHDHVTRSVTLREKSIREKLGSSVEPYFPSSDQEPSSMYLTLPTVLTEQSIANHRLDALSCNYIIPRASEKRTVANSERLNQMFDSSTNLGYFPGIQLEETIQNFGQMGSRYMGSFSQNSSLVSSIGAGLPVPLHQGIDANFSIPSQVNLENLSREDSNPLGMQVNGEAIRFSGGRFTLAEHFVNNNHQSHKSDGRLVPYENPNLRDGYFVPKQL